MNKILSFFQRFNSEYFFSVPAFSNVVFYLLGFYGLLFVVLIAVTVLLKRNQSTVIKDFSKHFFWTNFTLIFAGLFFIFNRYEGLSIFSWRFWQYLTILSIIFINLYFYYFKRKKLLSEIQKLNAVARKDKWLSKTKKKKK